MKFEWDPRKAEINLRKRGVSFDEAGSVFLDRLALSGPDPQNIQSANRGTLPLECHVWAVCSLFRIRTGLAQFESSPPAV